MTGLNYIKAYCAYGIKGIGIILIQIKVGENR